MEAFFEAFFTHDCQGLKATSHLGDPRWVLSEEDFELSPDVPEGQAEDAECVFKRPAVEDWSWRLQSVDGTDVFGELRVGDRYDAVAAEVLGYDVATNEFTDNDLRVFALDYADREEFTDYNGDGGFDGSDTQLILGPDPTAGWLDPAQAVPIEVVTAPVGAPIDADDLAAAVAGVDRLLASDDPDSNSLELDSCPMFEASEVHAVAPAGVVVDDREPFSSYLDNRQAGEEYWPSISCVTDRGTVELHRVPVGGSVRDYTYNYMIDLADLPDKIGLSEEFAVAGGSAFVSCYEMKRDGLGITCFGRWYNDDLMLSILFGQQLAYNDILQWVTNAVPVAVANLAA